MLNVILKLLSESLLSFYPAMVKYIKFPVVDQLLGRLVIYSIIASFFSNWKIVKNIIFSSGGLILAFVNLIHIYSSYIGFSLLEAGVSYSIFYIYPVLIIFFSKIELKWYHLIPLLGVGLLTHSNWNTITGKNGEESKKKAIAGILGIFGATITEVMLYFIVKEFSGKTGGNQWNILLVAYLLPAIVMSLILGKKIKLDIVDKNIQWKKNIILLVAGNAVIGALGYYLRFYTIPKLPAGTYSILSYFGIVMAYVYGWILNEEGINSEKIIGSLLIMASALFIN